MNKIGDYAFAYGHNLTSISLPEGLTSIGKNTFYDCSNLTEVSLPESCISIGQEAFSSCDNLMSISLPGGLTSIGIGAFSNCSSLTSISLPKSLAIIEDNIFTGCSNLTSIIIPEGPTSIGYGAFSNCSSLAGISLPESSTSIDKYAFLYCTSLTSISLSGSLASIDDYAFFGCHSLKSIQFNSAKTIINGNKVIPIETTIIGYNPSTAKDYAGANGNPFKLIGETTTLQSIAITTPAAKLSYNIGEALDFAGLVVTGTYSDGTTQIETITAANITGFDSSKAVGNQLLTITVNGKIATYQIQIAAGESEEDYEYKVVEGAVTIAKYKGTGGDVTVPGILGGLPVKEIGDNAFYECSSLTSVSLPESLTKIGEYAFWRCSNLTSISLPAALTSIGVDAFGWCGSLTQISLPKSLTSIGDGAFKACSKLTNITVAAENANYESVGGVLYNKTKTVLIACPGGLSSISLPESCTSIGNWACYGCSNLTSISLPKSLASIGDYSFSWCNNLTSISLPESLVSIGMAAFYECSGLTSISLPKNLTSIGDYSFGQCRNLKSVRFNSAKTIIAAADNETIPVATTIIGYDPSTAKDYADRKGNPFQLIGSDDPVEGDFTAFLGQDPAGNYYEYNATDLSNAYLAYQIKPTLPSAKMYQQFLNSKCQIVALKDLTKGYMDYSAAATASLMAQMKGEAFDINVYFGSSDARKFTETVENVKIIDKDGNVS